MPHTILVVDDDPDILEAIKFVLEAYDYEVVTDSGRQVDEAIQRHQPDLLLLDVLLSGLDGRDICRRLKHQPETKKLPVIMISAHADAAKSMEMCQADDFVPKPFEMDELLNKIEARLV